MDPALVAAVQDRARRTRRSPARARASRAGRRHRPRAPTTRPCARCRARARGARCRCRSGSAPPHPSAASSSAAPRCRAGRPATGGSAGATPSSSSKTRYLARRPTGPTRWPTIESAGGHDGLQRGEAERVDPLDRRPADRDLEPLGERLHLRQLGHGPRLDAANTPISRCRGPSILSRWPRRVRRSSSPGPAGRAPRCWSRSSPTSASTPASRPTSGRRAGQRRARVPHRVAERAPDHEGPEPQPPPRRAARPGRGRDRARDHPGARPRRRGREPGPQHGLRQQPPHVRRPVRHGEGDQAARGARAPLLRAALHRRPLRPAAHVPPLPPLHRGLGVHVREASASSTRRSRRSGGRKRSRSGSTHGKIHEEPLSSAERRKTAAGTFYNRAVARPVRAVRRALGPKSGS